MFFEKFADDLSIIFLQVTFVDIGGSEIFLECAMHEPVERFTLLTGSALNDQSRFFLNQLKKTTSLSMLLGY